MCILFGESTLPHFLLVLLQWMLSSCSVKCRLTFTKDHINVTRATAADPVALPPQLVDQEAVDRLDAAYQNSDGAITRPFFRVPNPDAFDADGEPVAGEPAYILNPEDTADDNSPVDYRLNFP